MGKKISTAQSEFNERGLPANQAGHWFIRELNFWTAICDQRNLILVKQDRPQKLIDSP